LLSSALALAKDIARYPALCMRTDRLSMLTSALHIPLDTAIGGHLPPVSPSAMLKQQQQSLQQQQQLPSSNVPMLHSSSSPGTLHHADLHTDVNKVGAWPSQHYLQREMDYGQVVLKQPNFSAGALGFVQKGGSSSSPSAVVVTAAGSRINKTKDDDKEPRRSKL
jgi:hypothetical protein